MKTLSISRWMLIGWVCYAFLPVVPLGIVSGIYFLFNHRDIAYDHIWFPIAITLTVLTQFSALASIFFFMFRMIVRPLAALEKASRQMTVGEWKPVALPGSRVREMAAVTTTFSTMSISLRDALQRQAELEEERRFFISAIAHDLRTPLFSLRGYLQGLVQGIAATPERTSHYLAICQQKSDELERLVADLFAYVRIDALEQVPQNAPLDLCDLANQVADGVRYLTEEKHITLEICDRGSAQLLGDRHLLTRAIENLLDNAVRHTPENGHIWLDWQAESDFWRITVRDSGPGIDPAILPHIFEPLYRGEASRNRQTGGAGLGLTIARRIIRAHNGDLVATNSPDGGACFTFTLPRQPEPHIAS
jgi:signal transduction histidine kinase